MKHTRALGALAVGAVVATVGYASASALTVNSAAIQHGSAGVTCDADGVDVNWGLETDDNSVGFVRVSGIDANCAGATLFVAVNGNRTNDMKVDIDSASELVPLSGYTANDIQNVDVWIEG
jgi:hypothetical protein